MKITAGNVLQGKVKSIQRDGAIAEVVIEVAPGVEVVSRTSTRDFDAIGVVEGQAAFAVFDASAVMVGAPHHKRGE